MIIDLLNSGASNNVTGSIFDDIIKGGAFNDCFVGGQPSYIDAWGNINYSPVGGGADMLYGRDGDDTLIGQGDNDKLYGGAGNDTLYGGYGRDLLSGGGGGDSICFSGGDTVKGGGGRDSFILTTFDGPVGGDIFFKKPTGADSFNFANLQMLAAAEITADNFSSHLLFNREIVDLNFTDHNGNEVEINLWGFDKMIDTYGSVENLVAAKFELGDWDAINGGKG